MRGVSDDRAVWLARYVLPHEPALRAWLHNRRVADIEVDDIVQETYAKLAGLDSIDAIREPKRYMFQTAYMLIVAHVRRSRVISISAVADLEQFGIATPEVSAEQELVSRGELNNLAAALASLPARCRQAFILRRVTGLSQRAVAERLCISEKTVEKYMAKSTRLLMDRFGRGGKSPSRASRLLSERLKSDDKKNLEPGG